VWSVLVAQTCVQGDEELCNQQILPVDLVKAACWSSTNTAIFRKGLS